MRGLSHFPAAARRHIRYVLADLDETLTTRGQLTAAAYAALERLRESGRSVVVVTGRSAGWCDLIARLWPVDAVIGENGAFYFTYGRAQRRLVRRFWDDEEQRAAARLRLDRLAERIFAAVPGAAPASDQPYRLADLAIDVTEDVPPLPPAAVDRILGFCAEAGARASVSSAHVNACFGEYDKLAMTSRLFPELFGTPLADARDQAVFIGDSSNDATMFGYFPHAVGVANIRAHLDRIPTPPAYVTEAEAGAGFVELVDALLA
ncbi:MAG TPA: HAD-IIB family hydrolase [Stellaceae bacterium]|nr:HAD-IIB family hydrolase [Stellaceae bacterium]